MAENQVVEVDGRELKLTNLDKVLYPKAGFTKGQVVDYYAKVAPAMVPHLDGRAVTLRRFPEGVEDLDAAFFEKRCPKHRPKWVKTARVTVEKGKIDFCVCDSLPTLIWMAQLAAIELHPSLSDGQRTYDLAIAEENFAGELLDVMAMLAEQGDAPGSNIGDPLEVASELRPRYESLWSELTRDEVIPPNERYRIDERLHRLNELGFDVEEVELMTVDGGYRLRLPTRVVEPGHHRRRLLSLTGLDVGENQARRLLNDIARYRAELEAAEGRSLPDSVVGYRWRAEVFEPAVAAIPPELHAKRAPAELFHELLDHRWYRSEAAGHDVGMADAVATFSQQVLPEVPDERATIGSSS